MTQEQFNAIVRHGLSNLGGILMAHGYVSSGSWEIASGLGLALASYAWSYVEKKMAAAK